MKTKEQIIAEQESIGNMRIDEEEYHMSPCYNGDFVIHLDDCDLYFRIKKEVKSELETEINKVIDILNKNELYNCPKCGAKLKEEHMGRKCPGCFEWQYYHTSLNAKLDYNTLKETFLILEKIREAERRGLWK